MGKEKSSVWKEREKCKRKNKKERGRPLAEATKTAVIAENLQPWLNVSSRSTSAVLLFDAYNSNTITAVQQFSYLARADFSFPTEGSNVMGAELIVRMKGNLEGYLEGSGSQQNPLDSNGL